MTRSVTHDCGARLRFPTTTTEIKLRCPRCGKTIKVSPTTEIGVGPLRLPRLTAERIVVGVIGLFAVVVLGAAGVWLLLSDKPANEGEPDVVASSPVVPGGSHEIEETPAEPLPPTNEPSTQTSDPKDSEPTPLPAPPTWLTSGDLPWSKYASRVSIGHRAPVVKVSFTPNSKQVISISDDQTARVWDVITGDELRCFTEHETPLQALAICGDGVLAATSCLQKILVWEIASGKVLFTKKTPVPCQALAFSPDRNHLFLGGGTGRVHQLWTPGPDEGTLLHASKGSSGANSAIFSADGREIYVMGMGNLQRWDLRAGRIDEMRLSPATTVAYAPGTNHALGGSSGLANLHLFNVQDGKPFTRLKGHSGSVSAVSMLENGRWALSGGDDRLVHLWNLEQVYAEKPPKSEIMPTVRMEGHLRRIRSVAFSPDAAWAASASDDKTVRIWNLQTGQEAHCLQFEELQEHELFSWTYRYALVIDATWRIVWLWDVKERRELFRLDEHDATVLGLAFSADERYAATSSSDGVARIWEVKTGRVVATLREHESAVVRVALSPDGKHLLTGTRKGQIRLWDVSTGQTVSHYPKQEKAITTLAFSPDGSRFLTVNAGKQVVRLWSVTSLRMIQEYKLGNVDAVWFSPDGQHFVCRRGYDKSLVYNVETGRPASEVVRNSIWVNRIVSRWTITLQTIQIPSTTVRTGVGGGTSSRTIVIPGVRTTTTTIRTTTIRGRK